MTDRLAEIFDHQVILMHRFDKIERAHGFQIPEAPIDMQSFEGQARIRVMAGRVIEEVGEVQTELGKAQPHIQDIHNEMADVLHFLVELCIVSGITPLSLVNPSDMLGRLFSSTPRRGSAIAGAGYFLSQMVWEMTDALHELKNKPWKQVGRSSNVKGFADHIRAVFSNFIEACTYLGMTDDLLHRCYFKKASVNSTRIVSGE